MDKLATLVRLVLFTVDKQTYALPLAAAERVLHMVEVTPLPGAPDAVEGVINIQGEVVPVDGILMSAALALLVLEGTRRMAGFSLVGFTLAGVVYAMVGHYLPGIFQARPVEFTRLLVYLNLDTNALLGTSLQIGVIVVVPFILLGQLLGRHRLPAQRRQERPAAGRHAHQPRAGRSVRARNIGAREICLARRRSPRLRRARAV